MEEGDKVLSKFHLEMIRALRDDGFAVVVFTPEELNGADSDQVEEVMIERGWNAIDSLVGEEE